MTSDNYDYATISKSNEIDSHSAASSITHQWNEREIEHLSQPSLSGQAELVQQSSRATFSEMHSTSSIQQKMPSSSIWSRIASGHPVSKREKRDLFIGDCAHLAETENPKILKSENSSLTRLAIYNVHVWANPHFKFHRDKISKELSDLCRSLDILPSTKVTPTFDTIRELDADILILQEAASDNLPEFEDYKKILRGLGYHYGLEFFGNMNSDRVVPYGPFGNWILSKYPIVPDPSHQALCQVTYYNTQMTAAPEGEYVDRCVIHGKIQMPNGKTVSIYGTHLDAFDKTEQVRVAQIRQLTEMINDDSSDHVIIAGDFNAVRPQDYASIPELWDMIVQENETREDGGSTPTIVMDHLAAKNYVDSFTISGQKTPRFTTWSGTTIDFIMLRNKDDKPWNLPIERSGVYYSATSDHLPVFMDLRN